MSSKTAKPKISTWVEMALAPPEGIIDLSIDELKSFTERNGHISALAEKRIGQGIEPHITLLWCGYGTTTEDVEPVLQELVNKFGVNGLYTTTGEMDEFGKSCISLHLNCPPGSIDATQHLAERLYSSLEHKPGMVDPRTRPLNPHITVYDFGANTNARELAMAQLRDAQPPNNTYAFVNRRVVFAPVYTIVTKNATTGQKTRKDVVEKKQ